MASMERAFQSRGVQAVLVVSAVLGALIGLQTLVLHLPQEDHERQLHLLDSWGRFGGRFQVEDGRLLAVAA